MLVTTHRLPSFYAFPHCYHYLCAAHCQQSVTWLFMNFEHWHDEKWLLVRIDMSRIRGIPMGLLQPCTNKFLAKGILALSFKYQFGKAEIMTSHTTSRSTTTFRLLAACDHKFVVRLCQFTIEPLNIMRNVQTITTISTYARTHARTLARTRTRIVPQNYLEIT